MTHVLALFPFSLLRCTVGLFLEGLVLIKRYTVEFGIENATLILILVSSNTGYIDLHLICLVRVFVTCFVCSMHVYRALGKF